MLVELEFLWKKSRYVFKRISLIQAYQSSGSFTNLSSHSLKLVVQNLDWSIENVPLSTSILHVLVVPVSVLLASTKSHD